MPYFLKDKMLETQWDLAVFPLQAQQDPVIRGARLSDPGRHGLAKTVDPPSVLMTFLH